LNQHLLSVKEVSSFLHVHPITVYKWARKGKIPYLKINGLIRFDKSEIGEWKDKKKIKYFEFAECLPKFDLSLEKYDIMLLKGRSALSKKFKRWNYGIGTIYIRKTKGGKERWCIDYRDENGERVRKVAKHAQSREEALLELQSDIRENFENKYGLNQKKLKTKFNEFAIQYLENYAKVNNLAWKRVESCLKNLCEFMGACYLRDISPLLIEKYKLKRLNEEIKPATVNRELSVLKRAFNLAIDWKIVDENPVRNVRFLRQPEPKERILSKDEEERLLEASSEHLKPIIIAALQTGMRKAEVANLRWEQVDMKNKEIEVVKTKSGKKRIIPISEDLFKELNLLRNRNGNSEFVFQYVDQKTGEKKHLRYFRRSFETACRRAKITGFTFHDLRHTFASRLVRSGVDLITVKDLLGHYSVKTTERYTHSNQEQKRKAVELLSTESGGKKAEKVVNLSPICHTEDKGKSEKSLIPLLSSRWAVSSVGRAQRSQR